MNADWPHSKQAGDMHRRRMRWSIALLAIALISLVLLGALAQGSHKPETPGCSENGPCVVLDVPNQLDTADKSLYLGRGAEYWHWQTVIADRKLAKVRKQLRKKNRADAKYAIKLAANAFSISESAMRSVAWCESKFNRYARNRSGASGLFQFINSTWRTSGMAVFSVFDPIANALGAAKTVRTDGGWGQWSCKP